MLDLGKQVKEAVQKQGMLAWQYNTIGVSDAITMGGEGQNSRSETPAKIVSLSAQDMVSELLNLPGC